MRGLPIESGRGKEGKEITRARSKRSSKAEGNKSRWLTPRFVSTFLWASLFVVIIFDQYGPEHGFSFWTSSPSASPPKFVDHRRLRASKEDPVDKLKLGDDGNSADAKEGTPADDLKTGDNDQAGGGKSGKGEAAASETQQDSGDHKFPPEADDEQADDIPLGLPSAWLKYVHLEDCGSLFLMALLGHGMGVYGASFLTAVLAYRSSDNGNMVPTMVLEGLLFVAYIIAFGLSVLCWNLDWARVICLTPVLVWGALQDRYLQGATIGSLPFAVIIGCAFFLSIDPTDIVKHVHIIYKVSSSAKDSGWIASPPKPVFPSFQQLADAPKLASERKAFFLTASAEIFVGTFLFGTAILFSARLPWRLQKGTHYRALQDSKNSEETQDAAEQKETRHAAKQEEPQDAAKQKAVTGLVTLATLGHLAISTKFALVAAGCDEVSSHFGYDWEIWLATLCYSAVWLLLQAVAVRTLHPERVLPPDAFGMGMVAGMTPFLSDPFDSVKDAMLVSLAFSYKTTATSVIGWAALLWLWGLHIVMLAWGDFFFELQKSYCSVLFLAPGVPKPDSDQPTKSGWLGKLNPAVAKVEVLCFEQSLPERRMLIMFEDGPQAVLATLLFVVTGRFPWFTIVTNLGVPLARILFSVFTHQFWLERPAVVEKLAVDWGKARDTENEALENWTMRRLFRVTRCPQVELQDGHFFGQALEEAIRRPLLHGASRAGDADVVLYLLDKADALLSRDELKTFLQVKIWNDETALHLACENGQLKVVDVLLTKADALLSRDEVNNMLQAKNKNGQTALHWACRRKHLEVVKILLEKVEGLLSRDEVKTFLQAKSEDGQTALHWACSNGHLEVVNVLLEKAEAILSRDEVKTFLQAKDKQRKTALHNACYTGHLEVLKAFLEKAEAILGRDEVKTLLQAEGKYDKTALHHAEHPDPWSNKESCRQIAEHLRAKGKEYGIEDEQ